MVAGQRPEGLQLGREGDRAVVESRPDERLLAEAVAREHESAPVGVPEREREHPVEPFDEPRPIFLVEMRQDGRVAAAAHLMAACRELLPELGKVVELAVEDRDDRAGLVRDGLVAELGIDHLEPLMAEHARSKRIGRALVGAAMADARPHPVDERLLRLICRGIESADPAHAPQCA